MSQKQINVSQAVVTTKPYQVNIQSVRVPAPGPEDLIINVTHSWVSNGTEGSYVRGERLAGDTPWRTGDPLPFPIITGYQKVGVVEWVGSNVHDISVGETVFATISKVEGLFESFAGHISPAVTHRSQVWKLPPDQDPLAFSGLVLTQVGYNCATRAPLQKNDAVAVLGDGLVGHWAAQTLIHRGARVCLIGKHEYRLRRFAARSADKIINISSQDVLSEIQDWAAPGLQAVIDTVGSVSAIEELYPVMRHQGHIVSAGFHGLHGHIDIQPLRARELTLHAPAGWTTARMDETLALIAQGVIQTKPLITHHFPVQQAAAAFDLILSKRAPFLGVILDWR